MRAPRWLGETARPWAPVALVTVLLGASLFSGFARTGFLDAREARDAEVAQELVAARDVITPLFGSEPLFEKPVLGYAAEAALRAFGPPSPVPSRALRALLGVVLVIVTGSVAGLYFGARAGACAAAVLATSLALPLAARADGTQLLGTLLGWLGAAGLGDAIFDLRPGRSARLTAAYGALALALVIAGPLPALWPLGGVALYATLRKRRELWTRIQPVAGLALMLGVALPWYGAMTERYGLDFLVHAPFFPYAVEARGPWLAVPMVVLSFLVIGSFPWSTLLPWALLHAATWWRARGISPELEGTRERLEENAAHYFIACLAASLAPLLIYPSPPLSAALPAIPSAALLCGRFLDHVIEDSSRLALPVGRAVGMLALIGSMGAVLAVFAAPPLPGVGPALRLLATVLFVTAWAPFLASFTRRRVLAALLVALPVAAGAPIVDLRLLPALEEYLNTRAVADAIAAEAPPRAPVLVLEPPAPSLRFYAHRNFVPISGPRDPFRRFRAADGHAYLAFRPSREHEAALAAPGPLEIMLRTPSLVLARVRPAP